MDRNFISLTVAQLWFCVFICPFNLGYVVISEVNCVGSCIRSSGGKILSSDSLYSYYDSLDSDILVVRLA